MQRGRLSGKSIFLYTVGASFSVLLVSLLLQWFVYDDWLHETGPLRIIGSAIAATGTFFFLLRWLNMARARSLDSQRRFELIAHANDKIAVACINYLSNEGLAESVREAVAAIDGALEGIVEEAKTGIGQANSKKKRAKSA